MTFQSSIADNAYGDSFITSFKNIECESDNPIDCIEKLKQGIVGHLITQGNKAINLQETPPLFKSYQKLITAKENSDNPKLYVKLLNEALEIDPNYFEPKVLKLSYYYNEGEYEVADSFLSLVKLSTSNNKRQKNLLNFYEALLDGNNKKIYDYLFKEYLLNPFELAMLVNALQYANKPEEAESIFNEIPSRDIEFANCIECTYRVYMMARADIELEQYDNAIALLNTTMETSDYFGFKKSLVSAYIRTNKTELLNEFLPKFELTLTINELMDLYMYIGKEYLLQNNFEQVAIYFNNIVDSNNASPAQKATTNYYLGNYKAAEELFALLIIDGSEIDSSVLSKMAVTVNKLGDKDESLEFLRLLDLERNDYQYGSINYYFAQYYASINNELLAIKHLQKVVAASCQFEDDTFQNDPHFSTLSKNKELLAILNFWN